jgi:ribosomal protein S18 acetylase RimI-like enzyme
LHERKLAEQKMVRLNGEHRHIRPSAPAIEAKSMFIRPSVEADNDAIWTILEPVIRAGETYAFPVDWDRKGAMGYWRSPGHEVFVADDAGAVVGTYYLRANQMGGGTHVANCGYVTNARATGRGIARAMCLHSLARARERGFTAMQFNFVVASNERAVALWINLGFAIVGTLPAAFRHPRLGLVDAYVMYRAL